MVREYVRAGGTANRASLPILGANAKRLRARGVPDDVILEAVREFARTKRWPGYVREWSWETQLKRDDKDHEARKKSEQQQVRVDRPLRRLNPLAALASIVSGLPAVPTTEGETRGREETLSNFTGGSADA